jgi:WD40 repeat protein
MGMSIWDVEADKSALQITGNTRRATFAVFSSDGSRIAIPDAGVRILDSHTGVSLSTVRVQLQKILAVAFTNNGLRVVTACATSHYEGLMHLYDEQGERPIAELRCMVLKQNRTR